MCVIMKLYNMFTFTTVCNLDCNNHGNATSDCLKCTCDPNWGESTCSGMYDKQRCFFIEIRFYRMVMFCFYNITIIQTYNVQPSSFMNYVMVIYIWSYIPTYQQTCMHTCIDAYIHTHRQRHTSTHIFKYI